MSKLEYTSAAAIDDKFKSVHTGFHNGVLQSLDFRRDQLRNLYYGILDNESSLKAALEADLHRTPAETDVSELHLVFGEIVLAIRNLDKWTSDRKLPVLTEDPRYAFGKALVRPTPYGVVLIVGPWNYPYLCTIAPIVSAIAAGNTVMFKPTEVAVESTRVLTRILESVLDPRVLQVTVGGIKETTQLFEKKWDKIMLTGSSRVGKVAAHAAAENLTPICLELGGKSPAIVTRNANVKLAAKRLAWSKLLNAGQTCIAPDYVIIDRKLTAEFVRHFKEAVKKIYPEIATANSGARDFGHIITERLWDRCNELVQNSTAANKWQWGTPDKSNLFYPPTLVYGGVTVDDSTMQDELFNPILPVIEVDDAVAGARHIVKTYHDYPLALYVFTNNKKEEEEVLSNSRSGSVMVNDAIMYGGSSVIPFGGVGSSGVGKYHGKAGFDEFSYQRPVVSTPNWVEAFLNARYPPYNARNSAALRLLSRPGRTGFGRTGKVKSGRSCLFWLLSLLIRKLGLTVVILAAIYHFRS